MSQRWVAIAVLPMVAATLLLPPNRPTAAPISGAQALIDILELTFETRLTEVQRGKILAASRGASQAQEREVVKVYTSLQAAFAGMEAWLQETRGRARQWVSAVAQGDPGVAAIVKAGDPNGAAPGLSQRARDAIIEGRRNAWGRCRCLRPQGWASLHPAVSLPLVIRKRCSAPSTRTT